MKLQTLATGVACLLVGVGGSLALQDATADRGKEPPRTLNLLQRQEYRHVNLPTVPCRYEDSGRHHRACYWDAGRRGDMTGYSLWWDRNHHVHYLNPRHRPPVD